MEESHQVFNTIEDFVPTYKAGNVAVQNINLITNIEASSDIIADASFCVGLDDNEYEERYLLSDSDSSDNESEDEHIERFLENKNFDDLANFCLSYLSDIGTNKLLKILSKHMPGCPQTAAELLGVSPELPNVIPIKGGDLLYLGIKTNLKKIKLKLPLKQIIVDFSWDGVRIFKASNIKMWPLVMRLVNVPEQDVILLGVFIGNKNPANPNEFFFPLIDELNQIKNQGGFVTVGDNKRIYQLKPRLFISDTPARSFALCKFNFCFVYNFKSEKLEMMV